MIATTGGPLAFDPPRLADVPALLRFMGDAEAMRWTQHHPDARSLRRHLAGHWRQARRLGFGPWTVRERATGAIVGWGGLNDDPFDPGGWGPEVAYFFQPDVWGRGYAGHLVTAALAWARALGLPRVRAFAHPENAGSRRVLLRAGFVETRFVEEMERFLYETAP